MKKELVKQKTKEFTRRPGLHLCRLSVCFVCYSNFYVELFNSSYSYLYLYLSSICRDSNLSPKLSTPNPNQWATGWVDGKKYKMSFIYLLPIISYSPNPISANTYTLKRLRIYLATFPCVYFYLSLR